MMGIVRFLTLFGMLGLLIDTVSPRNCVLLSDEKKAKVYKTWIPHANEAEQLLKTIRSLAKRKNRSIKDITHIVVVTGPGRFTSTRVGIVVANMLSYLLHCPIYGIDRLSLLVSTMSTKQHIRFPFRLFVQSERGDFFTALFRSTPHGSPIRLISHIPLKQGEETTITIQHYIPSHCLDMVSVAPHLFADRIKFQHKPISPLYVREANITKRKKR